MDFYDKIYYTLIGQMEEDAAIPGVPNAFAPGSECDQAYLRAEAGRRPPGASSLPSWVSVRTRTWSASLLNWPPSSASSAARSCP